MGSEGSTVSVPGTLISDCFVEVSGAIHWSRTLTVALFGAAHDRGRPNHIRAMRKHATPLADTVRSGFPWEKTTKGDVASVYTNCETAVALFSLAPGECFEGTSFARFCLSQNVRLLGGSNQGWMNPMTAGFG
jgi:hypothetical protein